MQERMLKSRVICAGATISVAIGPLWLKTSEVRVLLSRGHNSIDAVVLSVVLIIFTFICLF